MILDARFLRLGLNGTKLSGSYAHSMVTHGFQLSASFRIEKKFVPAANSKTSNEATVVEATVVEATVVEAT